MCKVTLCRGRALGIKGAVAYSLPSEENCVGLALAAKSREVEELTALLREASVVVDTPTGVTYEMRRALMARIQAKIGGGA